MRAAWVTALFLCGWLAAGHATAWADHGDDLTPVAQPISGARVLDVLIDLGDQGATGIEALEGFAQQDSDADGEPVILARTSRRDVSVRIPVRTLAVDVRQVRIRVEERMDPITQPAAGTPPPPSGAFFVGGRAYAITVHDQNDTALTRFLGDLTLTFLADPAVTDLDSVQVFSHDPERGEWVLAPAEIGPDGQIITRVDHLTLFAVMSVEVVNRPLRAGWTTLPFNGLDGMAAAELAEQVGGGLRAIFRFDPATQRWQSYRLDAPALVNTLSVLRRGDMLFLRMARDGLLRVSPATQFTAPALIGDRLTLGPGWNFVPFAGSGAMTIASVLSPIPAAVASLHYFDVASQVWQSFYPGRPAFINRFDTLRPNDGIFIRSTATRPIPIDWR